MKIYLVGGAVRDQLLGRPVQDRDWVVVGGTAKELEAAGYQQVGADFPVFLHPQTREEFALARTERRTGVGHRGFATNSAADVSLEQDLQRRDLTINAMAMDEAGNLIDPWGGKADLEGRVLRAVSPAFAEDPLRVLRVARFAAQLPGFQVSGETMQLMQAMVREHRLDELPVERVWQELHKVLYAPSPYRFLAVLQEAGALVPFFVEWQRSPPGDPGLTFHGDELFAVWCEGLTAGDIKNLCSRVRVPNVTSDFAVRVHLSRDVLPRWHGAEAGKILQVLERIRAFHEPGVADGILSFLERRYGTNLAGLRDLITAMRDIKASAFADLSGPALGAAIREARTRLLVQAQRQR
jgi:tRNA nucleotidyltransferase (CCA-adding enzyme)